MEGTPFLPPGPFVRNSVVSVIAMLLLVPSRTLPPLSPAESLEGLPEWLVGRWKCSDTEQSGWQSIGFDDSGWLKPALCPMADSGVVVDRSGTSQTEEEGYAYAFQHFWHPTNRALGRPIYFRRTFVAPDQYADSSTYLSVDDTYELSVNGQRVDSGASNLVFRSREYPIGRMVHRGRNVIAIKAINTGAAGGVRSHTDLFMSFPTSVGRPMAWRCSRNATPGWSRPGYDATRWTLPVILPAPMYKPQTDTAGMWIDSVAGVQEAVFFRQEIYLDGVPTDGEVEIAADNGWELWVNGKLMDQYRANDLAGRTTKVPIAEVLHHGWNAIGVRALNYGGPAVLYCLPRIRIAL